jgi:hypothetical protein
MAKIVNLSSRNPQNKQNISTTNITYLLTMTKKKVNKKQTSTLDAMPMSPPRDGGRRVPRRFIPYDGTKEEEIEALKLVFRIDGSNPFKDDAYNINRFKPMTRYDEADYNTYLLTLHSGMDTANKYVAIEDLMKHMFSTHHTCMPGEETDRYTYSRALQGYLHLSETPAATRRRTGMETPPRSIVQEYIGSEDSEEFDFSKDKEDATEVKEDENENEDWKTIKRAKDREQRMNTREIIKRRLTNVTTPAPPKQTEVSTLFESEDEESEDEASRKEEEKDSVEKTVATVEDTEDDAVSRLELREHNYLQEQEETKSKVLGEDIMEETMESKMEAMMERKMKVRYDKKEADWNQMQTTSRERMTQHAKDQVDIVQAIIQDVEAMITKLNTTLTMVTDQIEEATLSIQEIDKATTVIANYTDAANKFKNEFTTIVTAVRIET